MGGYGVPGYSGYQPPPPPDPLISPDYSGWWDRGVTIVKRGWRQLVTLQVIGLVLAVIIQTPVGVYAALARNDLSASLSTTTGANPATPADLGPLLVLIGISLLTTLVAIIVTSIVTLATVRVGVCAAIGTPITTSEALTLAVRRVFPLIGWQLLALPIYLAGVCACGVGVLYVAAVLLVLPVVVAVERRNAIGRCFALFNRNFGASLARVATIAGLSIGAAIVSAVVGAILSTATHASVPGDSGLIASSIISTVIAAIIGGAVAVFIAPLTLTAYADMRARYEQITTPTIAWELGIQPPPDQPWFYGAASRP
ncbi:MAG: hypothetical protein ACM3JP_01375 [Betaproteobacteria bacterium]